MSTYESTGLWSRSLAAATRDPDKIAKERLRTAYRQFWANAVTLSLEIRKDLQNLTLHDDAHFEALWSRADQIAGPKYKLTPLETFVLGGAILLHDAANCVAAFPGRIAEVQSTPEWRDAAAEWQQRHDAAPDSPLPPAATGPILFETLRSIHAERAETLASLTVKSGDQSFHLLQDDQLRAHLGALIGAVAASHHWDISALPSRLPERRGSLPGMPGSWFIRPVLLACLLRCADATQLDQQRAPDFLYGLLQIHGLSELHWRAQNRLSTPLVDPEDEHALVFTSTTPFRESDADAWWIAFDAIKVANREMQASDSLLRDLRLPPFALNRVRGAESPERLAAYVTVSGWRPVSAEVKVSRVDKIVEMFGGEKLYGRQMTVPLRELIQNAADAVRFRRELEPVGSGYEGSIIVRMRPIEGSEDVWLSVDDDGLGMSEAVLTGPLIDFGSSYVSSSLVKLERPGLLSKGKRRIGKFGIGFFSCFMIAEEVLVTSRPYDKGLNDCRTLKFREGAITRPLLLDSRPPDFGASLSTRVAARVSAEHKTEILRFGKGYGQTGYTINLAQLIGVLCPMLDVDVYVDVEGVRSKVHSRHWMNEDRLAWLKRILLPVLRDRPGLPNDLNRLVGRLSYLDPDDPSAGLACISNIASAGVATVGTLLSTGGFNGFSDEFVGAIDYEPEDPRRTRGNPRARSRLAAWATEQAAIANEAELQPQALLVVAQRVAKFGGDATRIASIHLNRKLVRLAEVFRCLSEGEVMFSPVTFAGFTKEKMVMTPVRERRSGLLDTYRPGELEYIVLTLEGFGGSGNGEAYYMVPTEGQAMETSFCALLTRYARERGFQINREFIERVEFAKYVGEPSARENLVPGKMIGTTALKLSAVQIQTAGERSRE